MATDVVAPWAGRHIAEGWNIDPLGSGLARLKENQPALGQGVAERVPIDEERLDSAETAGWLLLSYGPEESKFAGQRQLIRWTPNLETDLRGSGVGAIEKIRNISDDSS